MTTLREFREMVACDAEPSDQFRRHSETEPPHDPEPIELTYATQKARGLEWLASQAHGWKTLPPWVQRPHGFHVLPYNMPAYYDLRNMFARPCPVRPRHGFVESRSITTIEQMLDVYMETRKADEKGEVILTNKLTGRVSAVASDGGVTWGLGNDGVTGGQGAQFHIPCPTTEFTKHIRQSIRCVAGAKDLVTDGAYIELVEHENEVQAVQLRDGPSVTTTAPHYVPHRNYVVTEILEPTSSDLTELLAWERTVKKAQAGTLVRLKRASLASHLAVHGIVQKLAVACEGSDYLGAKVGDVLQPSNDQPAALKPRDYAYIKKALGRRSTFERMSAVALSVAVLHSIPYWGREPHLHKLRAQGALIMARFLAAACIGEARHFYSCGPGTRGHTSAIDWSFTPYAPSRGGNKPARETIQNEAMKMSLRKLDKLMAGCIEDFEGQWGRRRGGSSGYGGDPWANSSRIARDLIRALLAFESKPCEAKWQAVMLAYNRGVTACHNGGRALDKFLTWDWVDIVARAPQYGFLGTSTMQIVPLEAWHAQKRKKAIESTKARIKAERARHARPSEAAA